MASSQLTFILGRNNLVPNTNGTAYKFVLNSKQEFKNKSIALQSATIPYSNPNIDATKFANNTFKYTWPANSIDVTAVAVTSNVVFIGVSSAAGFSDGDTIVVDNIATATFLNGQTLTNITVTGTIISAAFTHANYPSTVDTGYIVRVATYSITLSTGIYTVDDVQDALEQACLLNKTYMVDADGNNTFQLLLIVNQPLYTIDFVSYIIPTAFSGDYAGWSLPSGASWSLPPFVCNPQLIIDTAGFASWTGISQGTYPPASDGGMSYGSIYATASTSIPNISPVTSYTVTIDIGSNDYSSNPRALCQITPDVQSGQLIRYQPAFPPFIPIVDGSPGSFTVRFLDQDYMDNVIFRDTQLSMLFVIMDRDVGYLGQIRQLFKDIREESRNEKRIVKN